MSALEKYYRMTADTNVEDLVRAGEEIFSLATACQTSSFQFLDHRPLTVRIAEDGGLTFPDFLYDDGIPLISLGFKRLLDALGVDNLFYKPIDLTYAPLGRHEPYMLALPPRIRAVRKEYMRLMDADGDESEGWELRKDEYGVAHYRINASAVGNYRIFKLADVWDTDIIVTHEVKEAVCSATLHNIYFTRVEEE